MFIKDTPDERAEKFLRDVLDKMTLQSVEIEKSTDENAVEFNLSGEEVGFVIGRRGETLDALQYLANLASARKNVKGERDKSRVTIDIEGYRRKREETLRALARKMAAKAIRNNRSVMLEPMNPYERRIIHSALQNDKYVATKSEGEEPYRHVVVALKK